MKKILIVHDGEYVGNVKDTLLELFPEIPDREHIATSDQEFFIERILEDSIPFDILIGTNEMDKYDSLERLKRIDKRPHRIVLISSTGYTSNGIEVITDIHELKN